MKDLLTGAMLVFVLVAFVCIGIAQVMNPDWFIRRSSARRGGGLLSDWNRSQFQIVGVIFAAVAAYILYHLFRR